MIDRIHILGASGSGTSTLGVALSRKFGYVHLDTDDYFWQPTDPPFKHPRELGERQSLLGAALDAIDRWVLSGSLFGWGDTFIPYFELVIFLTVPTEIRIARLKERERWRFGEAALAPGGARHEEYEKFMAWAASYDQGGDGMRSLRAHETWLENLDCQIVRLEGTLTIDEQISLLEPQLLETNLPPL